GAFPIYREHLLHLMQNDRELGKSLQLFELAKETLLPSEDSLAESPWHGMTLINYGQKGQVVTSLGLLLEAAQSNQRLSELREAVAAAVDEKPQWLAGPVVLAIIDARLGRPIDVRAALAALLGPMPNDGNLYVARWVAAQEFGNRPELRDTVIELLQR